MAGYLRTQKEKKSFVLGIGVMSGIAILGLLYYQGYKIPHVKNTTKIAVFNQLEKENGPEVKVWRLKKGVKQGTAIDGSNIESTTMPRNKVPDEVANANKEDYESKTARMDLPAKTVLIPSMLVKDEDFQQADIRKQEFKQIKIIAGLTDKDYVDVRLKRSDGTDDVVLSKKKVLQVNGQSLFLDRDEKEVVYINSATIEASLKGGELYTVIYTDPQNQPAAKVTYVPDQELLKMLDTNPNVLNNAIEDLQKQNNQASSNTNNTTNNKDSNSITTSNNSTSNTANSNTSDNSTTGSNAPVEKPKN